MNNIILIRNNKIAFQYFPGCFGDGLAAVAADLSELMTPMGLFIPTHESSFQALPLILDQAGLPKSGLETIKLVSGTHGVIVFPTKRGVEWVQVRANDDGELRMAPMCCGENGFAVVSPYETMRQQMLICVKLTKTIEEAVAMYSRHNSVDARKTLIWDIPTARRHMDKWFDDKFDSIDGKISYREFKKKYR